VADLTKREPHVQPRRREMLQQRGRERGVLAVAVVCGRTRFGGKRNPRVGRGPVDDREAGGPQQGGYRRRIVHRIAADMLVVRVANYQRDALLRKTRHDPNHRDPQGARNYRREAHGACLPLLARVVNIARLPNLLRHWDRWRAQPTPDTVAADLSVPERLLLFCIASGTDWQRAGVHRRHSDGHWW
jgi:hypothetical protein